MQNLPSYWSYQPPTEDQAFRRTWPDDVDNIWIRDFCGQHDLDLRIERKGTGSPTTSEEEEREEHEEHEEHEEEVHKEEEQVKEVPNGLNSSISPSQQEEDTKGNVLNTHVTVANKRKQAPTSPVTNIEISSDDDNNKPLAPKAGVASIRERLRHSNTSI
jgi:hypothetical protein